MIHAVEDVLGVIQPDDSITSIFNDPEQTVQRGFDAYDRDLFGRVSSGSTEYMVTNPLQVIEAMQQANPGDVVVMANGTWIDTRIVFEGNGT